MSDFDYIIVGGGTAGCVIAARLKEYKPEARVLLLEAGSDTRGRSDILEMQTLNLGGDLDWQYTSEPVAALAGRSIIYNQGRALGGGSVINSGGWMHGGASEYADWSAAAGGDTRWTYDGLLPYFRRCEHWFDNSNPTQHGRDGPIHVSSALATDRKFPLTDAIGGAWAELGVKLLPGREQNAGENVGLAYLCEGRRDGKRQTSANTYNLDGVDVRTEVLVQKVILEAGQTAGEELTATAVELADGSRITAPAIILSAGAFRTPQLLQLSGIGDTEQLRAHDIKPLVDLPAVGRNLHDHMSFFQHWRLRDEVLSQNLVIGSPNPLFQQPAFGLGVPADWVAVTDVPKDGLARAIAVDEGLESETDVPADHPLLRQPRGFLETFILYMKLPFPGVSMDTSHITSDVVSFIPTSRGTVTLKSARIEDAPKIDLNFLSSEVDRYVYRHGLRQITRLMLDTEFGRKYIAGETVPSGLPAAPLALNNDDATLDQRLALTGSITWHAAGTAAMGTVVDANLAVRGVRGLFVADASIIPVPLSAHLQAVVYALAEQAAAIIAGKE